MLVLCSHNITPLYLSPLIAYFGRSCVVCSKINNRIFDSEKERKAHTSAEYYEFFFGKDYEKEIRAVFDRGFLNNFDGTLGEIKEAKRYFLDKLDRSPRQPCKHCRECYNECVRDSPECYMDLKKFDEMLGIVATRRPLLFDVRISSPDYLHYFEEEEGIAGPSLKMLTLWGEASLWVPW